MKSTRNSGLTLIEVILAVAILSAGMAALLTASSRCLAALKQGVLYQQGQWTLAMGEADNPIDDEAEDATDWEVGPITYPNGYDFSRDVLDVELLDRREDADEDWEVVATRVRVTWSSGSGDFREEAIGFRIRSAK